MFSSVLIRTRTYSVFSVLNALALALALRVDALVPSLLCCIKTSP